MNQSKSLEVWLESATRNLNPADIERFCEDIRDHFAESVEKKRCQGITNSTAIKLAVEELGKPELMRKQLRKVTLSKNEASIVESCSVQPKYKFILYIPFCVFGIIILCFEAYRINLWESWFMAGCSSILMIFFLNKHLNGVPDLFSRGLFKKAFFWDIFAQWGFFFFLVVSPGIIRGTAPEIGVTFYSFIALVGLIFYLQLSGKIKDKSLT